MLLTVVGNALRTLFLSSALERAIEGIEVDSFFLENVFTKKGNESWQWKGKREQPESSINNEAFYSCNWIHLEFEPPKFLVLDFAFTNLSTVACSPILYQKNTIIYYYCFFKMYAKLCIRGCLSTLDTQLSGNSWLHVIFVAWINTPWLDFLPVKPLSYPRSTISPCQQIDIHLFFKFVQPFQSNNYASFIDKNTQPFSSSSFCYQQGYVFNTHDLVDQV